MSSLTEIAQVVEALPPGEQEALFRLLAARSEAKRQPTMPYRIRTHPGGPQSGIDSDKLGQLPEDS